MWICGRNTTASTRWVVATRVLLILCRAVWFFVLVLKATRRKRTTCAHVGRILQGCSTRRTLASTCNRGITRACLPMSPYFPSPCACWVLGLELFCTFKGQCYQRMTCPPSQRCLSMCQTLFRRTMHAPQSIQSIAHALALAISALGLLSYAG